MASFVEIGTAELSKSLDEIGQLVQERGGSFRWEMIGRERVFVLVLPNRIMVNGRIQEIPFPREVRIYTTITQGEATLRASGKDAIRIVSGAWFDQKFKPCSQSFKVLRTAPKGSRDERVAAFLDRLKKKIRLSYGQASKIRACPICRAPLIIRRGKNGNFLGCANFPACTHTTSISL